jgi:hypothetical protein
MSSFLNIVSKIYLTTINNLKQNPLVEDLKDVYEIFLEIASMNIDNNMINEIVVENVDENVDEIVVENVIENVDENVNENDFDIQQSEIFNKIFNVYKNNSIKIDYSYAKYKIIGDDLVVTFLNSMIHYKTCYIVITFTKTGYTIESYNTRTYQDKSEKYNEQKLDLPDGLTGKYNDIDMNDMNDTTKNTPYIFTILKRINDKYCDHQEIYKLRSNEEFFNKILNVADTSIIQYKNVDNKENLKYISFKLEEKAQFIVLENELFFSFILNGSNMKNIDEFIKNININDDTDPNKIIDDTFNLIKTIYYYQI